MATDIKEASRIATTYFSDNYGAKFFNLAVEEIERIGNVWHITIGYDLPNENALATLSQQPRRQYKQIRINNETSAVISMKIRELGVGQVDI